MNHLHPSFYFHFQTRVMDHGPWINKLYIETLLKLKIKVVNTVSVLVGMYRTSMYTSIKTSMFRTGLNTSHISTILANFGQYWPIHFFLIYFLFLVL